VIHIVVVVSCIVNHYCLIFNFQLLAVLEQHFLNIQKSNLLLKELTLCKIICQYLPHALLIQDIL